MNAALIVDAHDAVPPFRFGPSQRFFRTRDQVIRIDRMSGPGIDDGAAHGHFDLTIGAMVGEPEPV